MIYDSDVFAIKKKSQLLECHKYFENFTSRTCRNVNMV